MFTVNFKYAVIHQETTESMALITFLDKKLKLLLQEHAFYKLFFASDTREYLTGSYIGVCV